MYMKIGIDINVVNHFPREGLGNYVYYLLENLMNLDWQNEYTLYLKSKPTGNFLLDIKNNFKLKVLKVGKLWMQLGIPLSCVFDKQDVILFTTPLVPFVSLPCKTVVTIHDLAFMHLPEFPLFSQRYLLALTKFATKRVDRIIVYSQSTKKDIVKYCGINPRKINLIYLGYDDESYNSKIDLNKTQLIKQKYNLTKDYILHIGAVKKRKNILRLIEALNLLKKEYRIKHMLVIAGRKDESYYHELVLTINRLGLKTEIVFTGYIVQDDLPYLMKGADVFVFPSLFEGFGLPVLEAMATGIPVVASNLSSLPEVVGNAGILVNPYNIEEIAQAIYRVLTDKNLREDMYNKGLERAKMFSWRRTAQETLKVLEDVYYSSF